MSAARATWANWAGNQACAPVAVEHPASISQLTRVVRGAAETGRPVKAVASGHSFTDAACTSGVHVVLDEMTRVLHVDRERAQVKVEAGIPLWLLNRELAAVGLAMPNLGDIDRQTIAGAISTSTHGTGARLGGLATQVVALELVTASGDIVACSRAEEPDLFDAARVALGALGVLATVTLQCVPAFALHVVEQPLPVDDVMARIDELVDGNDHYELYWVPHTRWALTKANNRTDLPTAARPRWKELYTDELLSNVAFGVLCRIGRVRPSLIPRLATALPAAGRVEFVDHSHKVFCSPRRVRFVEMEYAVRRESVVTALERLRAFVDESGLRISFPVEVRFTAPDDVWLSTAHGRESAYIAVHVYKGTPYEQYFRGVEEIMMSLDGRPHWGKVHFQNAATLKPRYARFDDFLAVRDRLDPMRIFANAYTDRVLGP